MSLFEHKLIIIRTGWQTEIQSSFWVIALQNILQRFICYLNERRNVIKYNSARWSHFFSFPHPSFNNRILKSNVWREVVEDSFKIILRRCLVSVRALLWIYTSSADCLFRRASFRKSAWARRSTSALFKHSRRVNCLR